MAGGLVGINGSDNSAKVINCYATGDVGGGLVGGFIGQNYCGTVINCYSTGSILNGHTIGGFISSTYGCMSAVCTSSYWDRQTSGTSYSYQGTKKTTAEMMQRSTFVGWDFVGETANGREDIWRMCVDGVDYPRLSWEFSSSDFACPDGVDFIDYSILAKQWQSQKLSFDTVPTGGDGIVNFMDFTAFAQTWQGDMNKLYGFASQWLMYGMYNADIAPLPFGDGIVDLKDLEIFTANWLEQ
jgi:hypothetical protein